MIFSAFSFSLFFFFLAFSALPLSLSRTCFFEYVIVRLNGGQSFLSALEAKNHICSDGGAQSVSQILIEAGTKLNCVTFE